MRDRRSYAFALVSLAAAVDLADDGSIADIRLALGGVALKPWRAMAAEDVLRGGAASTEQFRAAADAELAGAVPLRDNAFKIDLVRRLMVAVLEDITAGEHP